MLDILHILHGIHRMPCKSLVQPFDLSALWCDISAHWSGSSSMTFKGHREYLYIYIYIYIDSEEFLFSRCTVHMMHFSLTPDITSWNDIQATPLFFFFSYDDWRTFINHWSSPFIVTKNSGKLRHEATTCLLQHLSSETTGTVESQPHAFNSIQTNAVACFHQMWIHLVCLHRKHANPVLVVLR